MALPERDSRRIVIAGASSLLGAELKSLLEESRFADADFRLLDEAVVAGTLTEAAGEPVVILPVEEGSFDRAKLVFFTGSPEFTRANFIVARHAGGKIIDLSGGELEQKNSVAWFPKLDFLLGREFPKDAAAYEVPSAAGAAASALTLALSRVGLRELSLVAFLAASEAGRLGVEELETQTGQLLSFQGVGQPIFDAQVAFNMLDRFGVASRVRLSTVRNRIRREVQAAVAGKAPLPAIQVLHTPVFYGATFTACADLDPAISGERIAEICKEAGFLISEDSAPGPSNVAAAGEKSILLAKPDPDPARPGAWWFWGAADNIRLPAANAVKLAEMLL
ncbi:MAG TPA: Asd/ArgC dimerization domain-containing protein [Candidatus Dormibacteraeota bacterium]|nr:Asd/ArgC dimerization domain-containing protein [Candidatus Dormibacteraeota bacterium]